MPYAQSVLERLRSRDIRVTLDQRPEKVGAKIRDAQVGKVPYMVVVGGKEAEAGTVAVRSRSAGDQGVMSVDALIERLKAEEASRSLSPVATGSV